MKKAIIIKCKEITVIIRPVQCKVLWNIYDTIDLNLGLDKRAGNDKVNTIMKRN